MPWAQRFEERYGRPPSDTERAARQAKKAGQHAASAPQQPAGTVPALTLQLANVTKEGTFVAQEGPAVSRAMRVNIANGQPETTLADIRKKASHCFGGAQPRLPL